MEPISSMAATLAAIVIALGPWFMCTSLIAYIVAKISTDCKVDELVNDKRLLQRKIDEQIEEIECIRGKTTTKPQEDTGGWTYNIETMTMEQGTKLRRY